MNQQHTPATGRPPRGGHRTGPLARRAAPAPAPAPRGHAAGSIDYDAHGNAIIATRDWNAPGILISVLVLVGFIAALVFTAYGVRSWGDGLLPAKVALKYLGAAVLCLAPAVAWIAFLIRDDR
ncbi:hypothetical protein CSPHI_02050 [Corynebacterium sphenisci DSM 44792]|uniref:Transmembrane protein n=1 Tax=Corynebacterium sphenisci DSM 44792 TaxID=1437874 RepID=A0A1L7CW73_9CORY|nr:hypothetical protein [Corynebacterium sphenisci]APT90060.1 hypothetical protein CSPHI_02050 [Corynebacterium sphenisci DSM 44792]